MVKLELESFRAPLAPLQHFLARKHTHVAGTHMRSMVAFEKIKKGARPNMDELNRRYPEWVVNLITKCLLHNPKDRPTADEMVDFVRSGTRSVCADTHSVILYTLALPANTITQSIYPAYLSRTMHARPFNHLFKQNSPAGLSFPRSF